MVKFLSLTFYLLLSSAFAQDSLEVRRDSAPLEKKYIQQEKVEEYRNDPKLNYDEVKTERTWWDDFMTWLRNLFLRFFDWILGTDKAEGALAQFIRALPYILLGILFLVLIKFFLKVKTNAMEQNSKQTSTVSLSEEARIIQNEDIDVLIKKALNQGDFRLAVRYYYLLILQKMTDKELIDWQLQKTNDDYLKELSNLPLKANFKKITRLYDYIWYGGFPLNEVQYKNAELVFVALRQTIESDV